MPYILTIILQLITLVHAVKNGKTSPWLYIIIFVPVIGSVAYIIVEILPQFGLFSLSDSFGSLFPKNTKAEIKKLEEELAHNQTVAHKLALADAYMEREEYGKAADMYKKVRSGVYEQDLDIMRKLSFALLKEKSFSDAVAVLHEIKVVRKGELKGDELLWLGVCFEEQGKKQEALEYLKNASVSHSGLEGNYKYCRLLKDMGHEDVLAEEVILAKRKFDGMFPRYKRVERPWMKKIESEIQQ